MNRDVSGVKGSVCELWCGWSGGGSDCEPWHEWCGGVQTVNRSVSGVEGFRL